MGMSPKRLGKYELLTRLGQGGMAEVWKSFDPQLQRLVAIKFLHANLRSDPDFMSRFVREGQAIAALRHPNIVQVYDFQVSSPEDENPMAYMVMDYIEGQTLADYLHHTSYAGDIPVADDIVRLFTSLGLAVDYAHQHGMIHRDIKPANILLDQRNRVHNSMGEPILTDFGIVKMLGAVAITSTGISMGTPLYISPEQVHGQAGNEKSDIYALGVILYEMCTGQPPYHGDNPYVILAQRISCPPEPPSKYNPSISPELDAVILRSLAMDPAERFPSASLLSAALAEAFHISIPDLIRHVLLSSQRSSIPPSLSYPALPLIEDPGVAMKILDGKRDALIKGDETILSNTGAIVVSANAPKLEDGTILSNTGATIVAVSEGNAPKLEDETILSNTGATIVAASEGQVHDEAKPSDVDDQLVTTTMPPSSDIEAPQPSSPTLLVAPVHRSITVMLARRGKEWLIPVCSILLVVLVSGGFISTYALLHKKTGMGAVGSASIGSVTFLSSNQFVNNGMQVHLSHVPNPSPGQRYYAWAQNATGTANTIFLGALQSRQGNATLLYFDSQHRNLLAYVSSFLVTEQSASIIPAQPARDRAQWRYIAMIPQAPSSRNHRSYLDLLRHLLVSDPMLERFQLQQGIDFWLLNNTQELYKEMMVISNSSNPQDVRQILVNLLYDLDGLCAQQELSNTPASKIQEDSTLAHSSSISLLDCAQRTAFWGYLSAAKHNLNEMVRAPAVPAQEVQRIVQISNDLNTIQGWLEQMRTDVLQLVHMDDEHLKQAQGVRNDLVGQVSNVISGRFDPMTQTLQPSVGQICNEITFLAYADVIPYKAA
jgi:eukaryotic-like serine/threonine-protein kinase